MNFIYMYMYIYIYIYTFSCIEAIIPGILDMFRYK